MGLAIALSMLAFSPWSIPAIDTPVERRPWRMCLDGEPLPALTRPDPSSAKKLGMDPRDKRRGATIRRGWSPTALMAAGGTLLAAGTVMKVWAPAFIQIDPSRDPWSSTGPARIGYSTGLPAGLGGKRRTVVLGTVGTVLQAIGAGALSRGMAKRQR